MRIAIVLVVCSTTTFLVGEWMGVKKGRDAANAHHRTHREIWEENWVYVRRDSLRPGNDLGSGCVVKETPATPGAEPLPAPKPGELFAALLKLTKNTEEWELTTSRYTYDSVSRKDRLLQYVEGGPLDSDIGYPGDLLTTEQYNELRKACGVIYQKLRDREQKSRAAKLLDAVKRAKP